MSLRDEGQTERCGKCISRYTGNNKPGCRDQLHPAMRVSYRSFVSSFHKRVMPSNIMISRLYTMCVRVILRGEKKMIFFLSEKKKIALRRVSYPYQTSEQNGFVH